MKSLTLPVALLTAFTLAGCATAPGPVEVTRFVDPAAGAQLGRGTIFIESAPGTPDDTLSLSPYKSAVAAELRRLGYTETDRAGASQIAQVRVEHYIDGGEPKRSPVSVGVGGSTGGYGSGVGLGIGINLGGGSKEKRGTQMGVVIRDTASQRSLWEGRADFAVPVNSSLAPAPANAQTVAAALFSDFPGNNGETIEVKVSE